VLTGRGGRDAAHLLRISNFRWFVIGNALAFVASQMRTMAQSWLVLAETDSKFWVGLVGGASTVTILAISPLAGVAADRLDRRSLLLASRVLQAVLVFTTALIVSSGHVEAWHLLVLSAGAGLVLAILGPAGETVLLDVVGSYRLLSANGLNLGIAYIGRFVGPVVGGVLIATYGVSETFHVVGVVVIATFGATLMLHLPGPGPSRHRHPVLDLAQGLRYVVSTPHIALLMFLTSLSVFAGVYLPLVPVYARDVLDVGSVGFGFLEAAAALGTLLGSFGLVSIGEVRRKVRMVVLSAVLFGSGMVVFAFSRDFYLSLAALLALGLATPFWMSGLRTVVQATVLDEMRGRVMGVFFVALQLFGLGWLIGGAMAEIVGNEATLLIGGGAFALLNVAAYWRSATLRAL
jgi:MFS family permease